VNGRLAATCAGEAIALLLHAFVGGSLVLPLPPAATHHEECNPRPPGPLLQGRCSMTQQS
jgi:hypothetical protein